MATNLPIPLPPRTPTPPTPTPDHGNNPIMGLGLEGAHFNQDALSPLSATFPALQFGSFPQGSPRHQRSPLSPTTPLSSYSPLTAGGESEASSARGSENVPNPFNFKPVQYTVGKPPTKSDIGRRRGHKYKHSSISHQIFLEPPPRTPLQLPASLPKPTANEVWRSLSTEQKWRGLWCFGHLLISGIVLLASHELLSMTVLSRLLFFDALGAFLCVTVDVGGNFPIWNRATIKHPFGLERSEVVAGLAMSVALLFMGLDLVSHSITHALEGKGGHTPHVSHEHERLSPGRIELCIGLALAATSISAFLLGNHSRIGKAMRVSIFSPLPSILNNPSHLLTISCCLALLLLPQLSTSLYMTFDRSFSAILAAAMLMLGANQAWTLGKILMMSYTGPGLEAVLGDIAADPAVVGVDEAKVWQVHYGLCQANLKLRVRSAHDMDRLRERMTSMVRNRLGGGYGSGSSGQKWEVSTQLSLDRCAGTGMVETTRFGLNQ